MIRFWEAVPYQQACSLPYLLAEIHAILYVRNILGISH